MDDPTAGVRQRRMIEDVDAGVLDTHDLSVADLFADAATTYPPADTVLGLFCQQAAALATLSQTEISRLGANLVHLAAALSLIDAAGALRCSAAAGMPADSVTAHHRAQLADALEEEAGRLLYAHDTRKGK